MKTLVDIDQEMIAHEQTLDDIYQMLYQNEVVVSGAACFYIYILSRLRLFTSRMLLPVTTMGSSPKRTNMIRRPRDRNTLKVNPTFRLNKASMYVNFHSELSIEFIVASGSLQP